MWDRLEFIFGGIVLFWCCVAAVVGFAVAKLLFS